MSLYLVNLKVKARSQKVTRILESQEGPAWCDTCFLINFGQGIRLLCLLGRVKQFSAAFRIITNFRFITNFRGKFDGTWIVAQLLFCCNYLPATRPDIFVINLTSEVTDWLMTLKFGPFEAPGDMSDDVRHSHFPMFRRRKTPKDVCTVPGAKHFIPLTHYIYW